MCLGKEIEAESLSPHSATIVLIVTGQVTISLCFGSFTSKMRSLEERPLRSQTALKFSESVRGSLR